MKNFLLIIFTVIFTACGKGNNNQSPIHVEPEETEISDWNSDVPDIVSKVPFTEILGTYRYYSKDKRTKFVLNEFDEFIEVPLTTVFSFTCNVEEYNKSFFITWDYGDTLFLNYLEQVRAVFYVNGELVLDLRGYSTDLYGGYIEISKQQLRSLLNKMKDGNKLEVDIFNDDWSSEEGIVVRLNGFNSEHPIFSCFDK